MFNLYNSAFLLTVPHHPMGALALALQTPDTDNSRLMVIFMGIAAISLAVLALILVGVLIALAVVALKTSKAISQTVQEVKAKVYPIIDKTNGLVGELTPTIKGITEKTHTLIGDLSPKISGITDDVHGVTTRVRNMVAFAEEKLNDFAPAVDSARETFTEATATARSANEKTARQVERVNDMVTGVLDWTNQIPVWLKVGLAAPGIKVRESAKQIQAKGVSLQMATKAVWTKLVSRRSVPEETDTSAAKTCHVVHVAENV